MPLRVLLVSGRAEVEDLVLEAPTSVSFSLERRPAHTVDPEECARDFAVVLIDAETTPEVVALGRALRAVNRSVEFLPLVSRDDERVGVESIKAGAFDYQLWPPTEPSDFWTLLASCLKKVAPPEPPPFPRPYGRFTLQRKLGEGGMAEVFLAEQQATPAVPARQVVVKRLLDNLASGEDFVKMFADEARISSLLSHPNIVRVHDFGRIEESVYLAMEYVPGLNLEELRRDVGGPLPPAIACYIVAEVCAGLGYAHSKTDKAGKPLGIVHRDVNPPNVLIADDGRVMLTDFGIAKAAHRYYETTSGVLKGKFEYMAPEQANGQTVDRRADIFCVGLVLYEMLSGVRTFQAATPIETLFLIQQCNPDPPSKFNPRIPAVLDRVVMKALAKDVNARYQEAAGLEKDLREFARTTTNPGPRDVSIFVKTARGQEPSQPEHTAAAAPIGIGGIEPEEEEVEATVAPDMGFRDTSPGVPDPSPLLTEPTVASPEPETVSAETPVPRKPRFLPAPELPEVVEDPPEANQESTVIRGMPVEVAAPPEVTSSAEPMRSDNTGPGDELFPAARKAAARRRRMLTLAGTLAGGGAVLAIVIWLIFTPALNPAETVAAVSPTPSPVPSRTAVVVATASPIWSAVVLAPTPVSAASGASPTAAPRATISDSGSRTVEQLTEAPTPRQPVVIASPSPRPSLVAVASHTPLPKPTPVHTLTLDALPTIPPITPTPAATPVAVVAKGALSVWVDGWATVYVDGHKVDQPAPFADVPFAVGKHRVTLENGAKARKDFDVYIAPGKTAVINGAFQ